jgi:16S rRNA (cytosine1402-N4)-methyltransferase
VCQCGAKARVRVLTRKPVRPGPDEVESNPRSSAAKLRAIEKLAESESEMA